MFASPPFRPPLGLVAKGGEVADRRRHEPLPGVEVDRYSLARPKEVEAGQRGEVALDVQPVRLVLLRIIHDEDHRK
jgi:hypothetical protein